MTDIATDAPIVRRVNLPRLRFAKIVASLVAISGLVGDAFRMAHVDPYINLRRQPNVVPDDALDGRDPTW